MITMEIQVQLKSTTSGHCSETELDNDFKMLYLLNLKILTDYYMSISQFVNTGLKGNQSKQSPPPPSPQV